MFQPNYQAHQSALVPPVSDEAALLVDTGPSCIALIRMRSARIIAGEGIVDQMTGRGALINRPRHGGKHLQRHQILITRSSSALLCTGDIVHLAGSLPGMSPTLGTLWGGRTAKGAHSPFR